ncbi:MAG: OmpA family protein [Verrucomicrobiales bacterium]|nr:OmpA family protein [Verrucomicrobiales bacterium]
MRFLLAAILFISAVVVFTLIAKVVYRSSVETEFERQAVAALKSGGFEGLVVDFDQHDARLRGFVDAESDIESARSIVKAAIPVARFPEIELTQIAIRPTIPPEVRVESSSNGGSVRISGVLGEDGEGVKALLGARLASIAGGRVDNELDQNPKRLPLAAANELAAVTAELVRNSTTAEVSFAEGSLTLNGTVPNDGVKEGILELAAMLKPEEIIDEIAVVDPGSFLKKSTLTLTRNRFGITLGGIRAGKEGEVNVAAILKSASPSLVLNDRRTVGDDHIAGAWEAHAETILPALTEHLHGEMTVEFGEDQIRITGITANHEDREKILSAIQPMLAGNPNIEVLADLTIEDPAGRTGPPSYLSATFVDGLLTLAGRVVDDSFVTALKPKLESTIPDLLIKNTLEVKEDATPAGWIERLPVFLSEALSRVEEGSFHFSGSTVRLEGTIREITDKAILQNVAINSVPSGYTVENQLLHPDEPFPTPELLREARAKLSKSLKQFPIYFDSNSEIVNESGREKVNAIASLLKETGAEVPLVATGFADNLGNAEYNRQLSLRRATAVVEALAVLEIPKETITIESKGEDVSGVARSERWKARRVEVSLATATATATETENSETE